MSGIISGIALISIILFILYLIVKSGSVNLREINNLIEAGEIEKAKNILQKIIYSRKSSPDAHFLMAKIYFLSGQYDYAQVELKSIIKNNKYGIFGHKDKVYQLLADSYLKSGKIREAYTHYVRLEQMNPEEYNVMVNLGKICLRLKEYEKSIQYFQKALKLRSTDPESIAGLGMCYYHLNDFDKARDYLEQAVQLDRRNHTSHYYLALILHKKALYDQAILEYEKSLPDKSLKLQSLYGIARCYQQKEIWTKAIQYYENAINLIEEEADKLKHNYNRRIEFLTNPLVLEIRYQLAECYLVDRNFAGAMEQWQEIDSVKPGYKDVKQKIQQNARYGKDRIQDFLIFKELEFEKVSRYMIQYLGYIVKHLEMRNKEEVIAIVQGTAPDVYSGKSLMLIKRGFHPVGERDVDAFYKEMQKRGIEHGIIVSAMGISPNAIRYALNRPIEFIGKNQVMRLLKKYEHRV